MKKERLIKIIFALVLIFGLTLSFAGDVARTGTAAGMQLAVPVGPRYIAMGGANISNVEGVDGLYWNPAGLAGMSHSAAGVFSTMSIFNDVNVNYLALGFQMGEVGKLAISLKSFDFGDIPLTTIGDPTGESGATYSPSFSTLGLTYSAQLTNVIQVGVTGKLISESIDRASASAFAVDAGIQYHDLAGFKGLSFGLVVRNIGTSMQYSGSGLTKEGSELTGQFTDFLNREASVDDLPASFEIGLGYKMEIDEKNSLLLSSNFNNYNYGSDVIRLGAEYVFDGMIAIRGGFVNATDLPSDEQLYRYAAGFGFNYDLGGVQLTLDYSFRDSQYFDGNNLFSLQIGF